jgi:hypothetical protein
MVIAWKRANQHGEFVLATASYMGFFTLLTQVHERYLYPAAVLSIFALAQDKRIWPITGALAVTFTYNLLAVVIPYRNHWRITAFGVDQLAFPAAVTSVFILFLVTRHLPTTRAKVGQRAEKGQE